MSLTIRAAGADEGDTLSTIAMTAKASWGYPAAYLQLWKADLTITAQYIETNMVVCADWNGEPVGFYTIVETAEGLELDHLFLHPDHFGHGIGDALLRHAMACARENGADALRIVSDPNAETFYAKYGAERVDMVPSQPEGRKLPLLRLPV